MRQALADLSCRGPVRVECILEESPVDLVDGSEDVRGLDRRGAARKRAIGCGGGDQLGNVIAGAAVLTSPDRSSDRPYGHFADTDRLQDASRPAVHP